MSFYIADSTGVLGQFASNKGYSDLVQSSKAFRNLTSLFEHGASEHVEDVKTELTFIVKYCKTPDVVSCAKALDGLLDKQDCVVITDGTSDSNVSKADLEEVAKAGNGVMVAFRIPEALAKSLSIDGGESPEQLHLTLAYLGKADEIDRSLIAGLQSCLQNFGMNYAPISGTLGGPTRFNATSFSDDLDVCVASFSCKGIQSFRKDLLDWIEFAGFQAKNNFEYTPHVTLAYINPEDPLPVHRIEPLDITFREITLYLGGEKYDYPLLGTNVAKWEEESENQPQEDDRYSEDDESEPEDQDLSQENCDKFELSGTIIKLDNEKHLVFGWFSIVEVNGRPVVDTQEDVITEATLESAAYSFVLNARKGGEMHEQANGEVRGVARLVESVVFTKEKQEAMIKSLNDQGIHATMELGCVGWFGGFFIDDPKTWEKIKTGELRAFSVGGKGKRARINL